MNREMANGKSQMADARLREILTLRDRERVVDAATRDGHGMLGPLATHMAEMDGDVVAAATIGNILALHIWTDRERVGALQSVRLFRQGEAVANALGFRLICVPCKSDSPYRPHMTRLGFVDGQFVADMFYKRL